MGKRLRTLMLEDSETDAELLVRHLRRNGYDVSSQRVQTANAVRLALETQTWDIILSDYSMPELNVMRALDILREHDLDIPFILVSGTIGEETAAAVMRAGAHDFFLKDRLGRLSSAIERELEDAQVRRDKRLATARLEQSERQLREAVQARDEFLSIASHELKTPLTPLVLQLEMALAVARDERSTSGGQRGKLESKLVAALKSVDRMTILINRLLDVTRITSGRLAISPRPLDLAEVVQEVVTSMCELARRSGSELKLEIQGPVTGVWDHAGLEIIVTNLLSNAIKFGCGRPIELTVTREGNMAHLVVVDHGIGMALEAQDRIFERFERAVPAEHYGGFGLGLWVTRQMVLAHGGVVNVSSTSGVGSTFEVTLPIALEAAA